ncbi:MAG: hypothetical protein Q7S22_06140 [Candidatus Micrarchaeota archaeon]|nr:hypothetical protein [Candidatus Micrarchaeota archaeon]
MNDEFVKRFEDHLREEELFKKNINEFIEHTTHNFSQIFQDREHDKKTWEDIYREVGKSTTEAHLLAGKVEEAKETVKKESTAATKSFVQGVADIAENLEGKTKIVEKHIEHFNFKRWLKGLLRIKTK